MKTGIFCVAAGAAVAFAQPHQIHHRHAKRDMVTETDIVYATAAPVVVYVDGNGNPVSTSTEGAAASTPTVNGNWGGPHGYSTWQHSAPAASSYSAASSAESTVTVAPTTTAASSPAESSTTSAAPASSSSSSSSGSSGYGIAYSPYNADGTCKSQSQVIDDFNDINDYGMARIYGTDCNQVSTVLSAASAKGMKLFAGVYDITAVTDEINTIISAAKNNWDAIHTISIGNEGVQNGAYSVSAVVSAMNTARSLLKAAGYTGNVVTVDTTGAIMANPALCAASDYVAANCHAFFNADITASQAGAYVLSQAQAVSAACGSKDTVITESGYPWQGEANGLNVPSPRNQAAAIASLKSSFSNNLILFTAFNDLWKKDNSGTFGAEKYWGIFGDAPA